MTSCSLWRTNSSTSFYLSVVSWCSWTKGNKCPLESRVKGPILGTAPLPPRLPGTCGSETRAKKPSKTGGSIEGEWGEVPGGNPQALPLGFPPQSPTRVRPAWARWTAPGLQRVAQRGGTLTGGQQRARVRRRRAVSPPRQTPPRSLPVIP